MEIIITQWGLDSYLDLVPHSISKDEYQHIIRPDVLRLKKYPNDTKFAVDKFWSPAKNDNLGNMPNGYKMKWHQIGNGKMQLRLPTGMFPKGINKTFYLCAAYIKENSKQEQRQLKKFKTYLQIIRENKHIECGRL